MDRQKYIPEEIYDDEAVIFIAERHHTTPQKVVQCFIGKNGIVPEKETTLFKLEENEARILRDMLKMYDHKPNQAL